MQKYDLNTLIEYDEKGFSPKVLMNEPGYRMVLLTMRAGQQVPEHTTQGRVTAQVILGHISFYVDSLPCELYAGQVVCIENGLSHRIEAREDSALFVLSTGGPGSSTDNSEELDLTEIPRRARHPLVIEKFDALAVGSSFTLTNDHDPKPLNRQIENMRPGQVGWEYIQRGPELFRVRIRRIAPPDALNNAESMRRETLGQKTHQA